MKKAYIFLVFALVLGMSSCKKDKTDPAICSQAWALAVADEVSAVSAAALAYSSNPTPLTCVAYKDAFQDYLDALEPFLACASYTPQQKADLQAAIDDAQVSIDGLTCE